MGDTDPVNATELSLVPSWRLGTLLRRARAESRRTVDQVAGGSDTWTASDLLSIEQGDRSLTDGDILDIVALYGVDPDELLPGRHELVVDLDQRELAAAGHTQPLAGTAPTADEVLASYLSLVHTLRATEPGTAVALRQADVDVLARALALATPEVEDRLRGLMAEPAGEVAKRSSLLRARVLIPAAGVLVAVCVGGALVVSSRSSSAPSSPPSARIGSAEVVTRNPNGSAGTQHPRPVDPNAPYPGQPAVVTGNGVTADQIPPGGVGLAPAQSVTRDSASSTTSTTTG
jgi:hypothetical protein